MAENFNPTFENKNMAFKKLNDSKKTQEKFSGRLRQTILLRPLMLKINKEAYIKPKTLFSIENFILNYKLVNFKLKI